jgi:very-short-patch-repair endonuclease
VPVAPYRPEALRYQLFRGTDAIDAMVLTRNQLRSGAWVRLGHDVYADSRLERDHELTCRAVALELPRGAAFAGPSAAFLLGVPHAAEFTDPVHVVVPTDARLYARQGVRVHRVDLKPGDVEPDGGGLPRTTPTRTVWDLAGWLEPVRAVPIIDSLYRSGVVDERAVDAYITARRWQRGHRRATRTVELADARAQSPPESVLRVRLMLNGIPRPVVQHEVRLSSVILHPDLAWPEYRVAMEYDGEWHGDPRQLHHDRRRLNKLVADGWIVLHVTNEGLRRTFTTVLTELRTALRSRGWAG